MILLLILVEVFAIGANFALPFMREASLHQRAVAIAQDMQRVRLASLEARNANTDWSAPPQPGALPSEVESRLPGLSFTHEDYRMVWDRWEITDPGAVGLAQHDFAAVTVITSDPELAAFVARELPSGPERVTLGNHTTLVIVPPDSTQ